MIAGPVIDIADTPHDAESWVAYLQGYRREAPQYLAALSGAIAATARLDLREARLLLQDDDRGLATIADALAVDIDEHAGMLRSFGVRRQVLQGEPWAVASGGTVNDRLLERAARHPDLFEVWCGIDLADAGAAIREIDRCVERGARGVNALLFRTRVDPLSDASHRVYSHIDRIGLPLWTHCSFNLAADRPMHWNSPTHIDRIAIAHPDLVLIAGHGGWPWVLDLCAVALRHANVYLDTSVHDPGEMALPGNGFEPLLFHIRGPLRRRVLFGSAGWARGARVGDLIAGVRRLQLPAAVERAWLHDNAARVLRIDVADAPRVGSPA